VIRTGWWLSAMKVSFLRKFWGALLPTIWSICSEPVEIHVTRISSEMAMAASGSVHHATGTRAATIMPDNQRHVRDTYLDLV
jgi:hypothetical protein